MHVFVFCICLLHFFVYLFIASIVCLLCLFITFLCLFIAFVYNISFLFIALIVCLLFAAKNNESGLSLYLLLRHKTWKTWEISNKLSIAQEFFKIQGF